VLDEILDTWNTVVYKTEKNPCMHEVHIGVRKKLNRIKEIENTYL
jgi:hypothetical protein